MATWALTQVCETPGTVGEAQQLLKEAMGLPDISTAEGGRYTGALIGGEVICAAREDMRWELGPAQRLALCMLITRLREVRASLSSTSVELMRAESAATAAQAMCGAIARRRAAAETEVLHLKNEYQRTLQLSNVEDVQRWGELWSQPCFIRC